MWARRERFRKGECRGFGCGIKRDVSALRVIVDGGGAERHVDRIEREPCGGLAHLDVHGLDTFKLEAREIWRELDRIVEGNNRFRQFARRGVEGIAGLGDGFAGQQQGKHDGRGQPGGEVTHRARYPGRILGEGFSLRARGDHRLGLACRF